MRVSVCVVHMLHAHVCVWGGGKGAIQHMAALQPSEKWMALCVAAPPLGAPPPHHHALGQLSSGQGLGGDVVSEHLCRGQVEIAALGPWGGGVRAGVARHPALGLPSSPPPFVC